MPHMRCQTSECVSLFLSYLFAIFFWNAGYVKVIRMILLNCNALSSLGHCIFHWVNTLSTPGQLVRVFLLSQIIIHYCIIVLILYSIKHDPWVSHRKSSYYCYYLWSDTSVTITWIPCVIPSCQPNCTSLGPLKVFQNPRDKLVNIQYGHWRQGFFQSNCIQCRVSECECKPRTKNRNSKWWTSFWGV